MPYVTVLGGRVTLDVPPLLCGLLAKFPGVDACVGLSDPKPDFSTYASLMSLPHLLGLPSIPPPVKLDVPEQAVVKDSGLLKVGVAWAGNASHQRDRLRSIPLAEWNAVAQTEGVQFTSLQMGPANPRATSSGHSFRFVEDCAALPDFAALAQVVARQDLIITVDTAVAHLAGTMGKPVWILLSNAPDWCWGFEGDITEWYPTARLFRQSTPCDWSQLMAEVVHALQLQASATRQPADLLTR